MSDAHLLPPNATAQERALSAAAARLGLGDVDLSIAKLWDPYTCTAEILPWLAWALSVDEWDATWSEQIKRQMIAGSIALHRRLGTVWAVRQALEITGYADANIIEQSSVRYDGQHLYDELEQYGGDEWAIFQLISPIDNADLSRERIDKLISTVNQFKSVRCWMDALTFRSMISEEIGESEESILEASLSEEEEYPWGHEYDGNTAYDGLGRYDDLIDDLAASVLIRHRDISIMDGPAYSGPYHDGHRSYDGFAYGDSAPFAVDAPMSLTIIHHGANTQTTEDVL